MISHEWLGCASPLIPVSQQHSFICRPLFVRGSEYGAGRKLRPPEGGKWHCVCVGKTYTAESTASSGCVNFLVCSRPNHGYGWVTAERPILTKRRSSVVRASAGDGTGEGAYPFNLDEYMVTLEKPVGIRFAQNDAGKVYVEALAIDGNALKCQMIMVGDVLKKTSAVFGDAMWEVEDFGRVMYAVKARSGPVSLVFERASQFSVSKPPLPVNSPRPWNIGHVGAATWHSSGGWDPDNRLTQFRGGDGGVGCLSYIEKNPFWKGPPPQRTDSLKMNGRDGRPKWGSRGRLGQILSHSGKSEAVTVDWTWPGVGYREDAALGDVQWATASDYVDYMAAVHRAAEDQGYDHSGGMNYSKILPQLYVGSCMQVPADVLTLKRLGITAVLSLQPESDALNWGINRAAIKEAAEREGLVIVDQPIKAHDPHDLRMKLPVAVGVLHRLIRKGHHCYVMSSAGLSRAAGVVIAYLHWICGMALSDSFNFITSIRPSNPDRGSIVAATWDAVASAQDGRHMGPPTHVVQLTWNHGGSKVQLVGEFSGGWNQPIPATAAGGLKFVLRLRLPQGKYRYKYIVDGQWRHETELPVERDEWGNVNNVLFVGSTARHHGKELIKETVIERPMTNEERYILTYTAHYIAFLIDPSTFSPKPKKHPKH